MSESRRLDSAAIDALGELRSRLATLEGRLEQLEREKQKVHPVVYERVRVDYGKRQEGLLEEIRPLAAQARRDGAALRHELADLEQKLGAARLDKEELEVRHRLGELAEPELAAPMAAVEGRIAEAELAKGRAEAGLEQLRRVLPDLDTVPADEPDATAAPAPEAVEPASEEVIEAISAHEPPPAESPPAEPPPAEPPPAEPAPVDAQVEPEPVVAPVEPMQVDSASVEPAPIDAAPEAPPPLSEPATVDIAEQGTVMLPVEAVEPPPPPPPPVPEAAVGLPAPPPPPPAPPAGGSDGATVVLDAGPIGAAVAAAEARGAFLIAEVPIRGLSEIRLGPLTSLGRISSNSIQIDSPSVSRRHAEIAQVSDGYVLRDFGSENGTLVNGERLVGHRRLIDGDRLELGTVAFVFRQRG